MAYDMADRDVDDLEAPTERKMALRILAALAHPDCPVSIFGFEASKLSRHIAIRLSRMKGPKTPKAGAYE